MRCKGGKEVFEAEDWEGAKETLVGQHCLYMPRRGSYSHHPETQNNCLSVLEDKRINGISTVINPSLARSHLWHVGQLGLKVQSWFGVSIPW